MEHVLVVLPFREEQKRKLEQQAPDYQFQYIQKDNLTKELLEWATILIGNVPIELLSRQLRLKWVQLNNAGTEGYLDILPAQCILTNATGAYGDIMAEHILAMLLMLMKRLDQYYVEQQLEQWKPQEYVHTLREANILVVGFGDIGQNFAEKVSALGAQVYGIRRTLQDVPDYVKEMGSLSDLKRLLPKMDVVVCCLPGYDQTELIFDKECLLQMKKNAFFLNVGRGRVVDTDALVEQLNADYLGGAGLDVTNPEPLPKGHPLWKAKRVILTPHVSGQFHYPKTMDKVIEIATDNLSRFATHQKMNNEIDFETGYCKR